MQSFMSKFASFAIRSSGRKREYADYLKRKKYIEKRRRLNAKPFKLPPFPYRAKTTTEKFEGIELISFNKGREKTIVYLHGGAFCEQPLLPHFWFVDNLASKTKYEVLLPVYKKAPEYTFEPTFEMLEKLYGKLLETKAPENIVFMGDSSGGGLALSFCEHLKTLGLPQPKQMILLSPWLDISMDTPFSDEIDKVDPNLQYDFLKEAGKNWAGETDVHDYRLSPTYGDLRGLAPMTVYYGTYENLITDGRLFKEKCEKVNAQLDFFEYENMNHVFVIYPIPEAKKAQGEIIELLNT